MRSDLVKFVSRCAAALVAAAVVGALRPVEVEAIPAFARKYQTSCQTCHIAFPKLNPFGESFRLRGYRMPAETEDMIKEPPIVLGAPAYKQLWPDAVWPSDMPGTIPFSVNAVASHVAEKLEEDGETHRGNAFRFPEAVGLLSGGTLGETLSFLGAMEFEPGVHDGEAGVMVEIEHSQLNFNGSFGSGTAFNLKVGRFAPEITQPVSHAHLLTTGGPSALLQFEPVRAHGGREVGGHHGGFGISLPHTVDGLEVYGILGSRFLYSGGIANGMGPGPESLDGNTAKDVFGRVAYKFGGLPYDGSDYTPPDRNWRELSLAIGGFAYRGNGEGMVLQGTGHHADEFLADTRFTRLGFDVNAFAGDLNVMAGFMRGRDRLATYVIHEDEMEEEEDGHGAGAIDLHDLELEGETDYTYRTWFVQGEYVFLPWLHGSVRYEWLDPASRTARDFKRIVPSLTALIRANVKSYVEFQRDLGESSQYVLVSGLQFAF